MTPYERPSSRMARSAAPDRKRRTPARGNESGRKQADLPVAKSAQGAGTSQVLENLNAPPAQSRLTTCICNYPEAGKG